VGGAEELATETVAVRDAVLHRPGARVDGVRLRYRARPVPCEPPTAEPGHHPRLQLRLREPVAGAAPGQLAALLDGETIVGHATIA